MKAAANSRQGRENCNSQQCRMTGHVVTVACCALSGR
jgi:hypothetical protein